MKTRLHLPRVRVPADMANPRRRSNRWIAGLTVCVLCFATGCTDLTEVDDLNIVTALGVDQVSPTEVRVTAEIPFIDKKSTSQQSSGGGATSSITRSQTGPSFAEALNELEYDIPHNLFLSHNTVVVFGDSYARQGLGRALDYLERNKYLRRNELLVVTHGSARDVLTADASPMTLHARAIRTLIKESAAEHRTVYSEQLQFIRDFLNPPQVAPVAVIDKAEDHTLRCDGVGLVSQGRLVSYLSRDESLLLGLLQGKRGFAPMTIPCPPQNSGENGDSGITLALTQVSTVITPTYDGHKMHFRIAIRGRAELERVCRSQKVDPKHLEKLQVYINQYIANSEQSLLDQLEQQNVDAAQLGGVIYRRWPRLWRQVEAQWHENMRGEADATCDVNIQVIRTGLASNAPLSQFNKQSTTPKAGYEESVQ